VALVPFSSVDSSALRWIRTQPSPAGYSLRAGEQEVATLSFERSGGSRATARTAEATWTLKRAGFLQPTILVRQDGRPEPVARLSAHLTRHEIVVGRGPGYRLRHVSHLVPAWRLTTDRGEELLHIEPVPEGRALEAGAVIVSEAARAGPTLLLAVVSWYFIVLSWFEDEAIEALAPYEWPDPPLERGAGRSKP
jgi:hypothetical protein